MTPLGHAVSGYLVGRLANRVAVRAALVGALLVDVDFLLVYRSDFNALHRTFCHSLLFVFGLALAGGVLVARERRIQVAAGLALGGLSHLFFDSILDANPSNGVGVSWFWPIHDEPMTPFNLLGFSAARAGAEGWNDVGAMLRGAAWPLLFEAALCVLLAAIVWLARSRRRRS